MLLSNRYSAYAIVLIGIHMSKHSIYNVARYIVSSYMGDDLTSLKLQKLTYYCQAWSLAWDGSPLDEDFQAWSNGPVCVDLYKKHAKTFEIAKDFLSESEVDNFTDSQKETMNSVINYYGQKKAYELSSLYA